MFDQFLISFLEAQEAEGLAFAAQSDVLELAPVRSGLGPPDRYLAFFRARTIVRARSGGGRVAEGFHVGITFGPDWLHRAGPEAITWLAPDVFHPNVARPWVCLKKLAPGAGLVDLLIGLWELGTYRKVTMREDDALDRAACEWARQNMGSFPVCDRPLLRRKLVFEVEPLAAAGGAS